MGKEHGFRPYATRGTYQQMRRTIPQKGMLDQYKQRHSEFKKPYTPDDGYQAMEYEYDPVPPIPPIPPTDPIPHIPVPPPGGTEVFACWAEGCCCDGVTVNLKVHCTQPIIKGPYTKGSDVITSNKSENGEYGKNICYTTTNCPSDKKMYCDLRSPADEKKGYKGQIIQTEVSMLLVDECADCSSKCTGTTIGFTTQTMSLNETQVLTVTDPVPGVTYSWKVTEGGGSVSPKYGSATIFTAPSTNPNCTLNPTIALYANFCEKCDELDIAINSYNGLETAATYCKTVTNPPCGWEGHCDHNVRCNGVQQSGYSGFCSCLGAPWDSIYYNAESDFFTCATWGWNNNAWNDRRSAEMIAAGCCPEDLM